MNKPQTYTLQIKVSHNHVDTINRKQHVKCSKEAKMTGLQALDQIMLTLAQEMLAVCSSVNGTKSIITFFQHAEQKLKMQQKILRMMQQ